MRMMKTLWLLGAAALALGLSGCGGGGGTRPAAPAAAVTPPAVDEAPAPVQGKLEAGGVTVGISWASGGSQAGHTFTKGEDPPWTDSATPAAVNLPFGSGTAVQDDSGQDATQRIVVYTDIKQAMPTPFHEVKGDAPYTVMGSDTVVPGDGTEDNLPTVANQSLTLVDNTATMDVNEATFDGTLDEAAGTFTCTVDPCTLSRGAGDSDATDDDTWALVGGWSFTAAEDATGMIDVPDADYLAFGYWNMIDIESLADVMPFYYGAMPYAGNVQALSGTANYTGNAAGGYEHKTYDAGTGTPTSTYGHFTAAVRLNAFFGGEDGMSTIDGIVDAFDLEVQGSDPALDNIDWEVMLNRTEVTGQNFMGTTNGGNWNGAFFGPSDEEKLPSGVAGGFNASLGNGAVKGAYGATQPQP